MATVGIGAVEDHHKSLLKAVSMDTSILRSTKKILGLAADYTAFDLDVVTHINTAFTTLTQLGIGPTQGFAIQDDSSVWADFMGANDYELNSVKSYVYLRVRLLFDPPATSYLIAAFEKQLQELEWRLSAHREDLSWVDPNPVDLDEEEIEVLDGGVI